MPAATAIERAQTRVRHEVEEGLSPSDGPGASVTVATFGVPAVLGILSLGTAGMHFAVIGEHLGEYAPFGLFFSSVAWLEALWAIAVVRRFGRRILLAGLIGNVAVAALWTVSRTSGLPIGPEHWIPEPASTIDISCTAMEAMIAAGCAGALWRDWGRRLRGTLAAFVTAAALLLTITITTVALVPAPAPVGQDVRKEIQARNARGGPLHGHARSEGVSRTS